MIIIRVSSGVLSEPSRPIISVYVEVFYDSIQKLLQDDNRETTVDSLIVVERGLIFVNLLAVVIFSLITFTFKQNLMLLFYIIIERKFFKVYIFYIKFAIIARKDHI